ncbi:ionotropic receptor 21a isoform X2 [Procambarus clarkii]|uniref:ionotropic receptor 21a isoform X2 n=1 Tax=Procambarus clarkii TaxID=6728 RepID=UPI001E676919|nr:ionotropic receptor 21a-like [Procambarus clarkii]
MLVVAVLGLILQCVYSVPPLPLSLVSARGRGGLADAGDTVRGVMEAASPPNCTILILTDGTPSARALLQRVEIGCPWGVWRLRGADNTSLLQHLTAVRKVRRGSWGTTVVVASEDPVFLAAFAQQAQRARLLVWETRLLLVTRLPLQQVQALLQRHWTFSMMNTILINVQQAQRRIRCGVYTHLPYSREGARLVLLAQWSSGAPREWVSATQLFQEKFANFHGAQVPVTMMLVSPFWKTVGRDTGDGTTTRYSGTGGDATTRYSGTGGDATTRYSGTGGDATTRYSGRDCLMINSVARALNFSIGFRRSLSIVEVMDKLEDGSAMISAFRVMLIPQILARVDHTYFIERATFTFSMAKPTIKPLWQNMYYPLRGEVWVALAAALLVMPGLLYQVAYAGDFKARNTLKTGSTTLKMVAMMLGQDIMANLSSVMSVRMLVAVWAFLAFIIGTAYRGTLTAFLTIPKYPARPETIDDLARVGVRAMFIPNATQYLKYFQESNLSSYKSVSSRVDIVESIEAGLKKVSQKRVALFHERYNMELYIEEFFTSPEGSTPLYVARHNVIPNYAAYMTPHDAPYKHTLDLWLLRIIESGLKEKFTSDMVRETWQEVRHRRQQAQQQQDQQQQQAQQDQQQQAQLQQESRSATESGENLQPLSMTHLQGPFWALLLGLLLAGASFVAEVFIARHTLPHSVPKS